MGKAKEPVHDRQVQEIGLECIKAGIQALTWYFMELCHWVYEETCVDADACGLL